MYTVKNYDLNNKKTGINIVLRKKKKYKKTILFQLLFLYFFKSLSTTKKVSEK